jgi:translocation and assembly module TamB
MRRWLYLVPVVAGLAIPAALVAQDVLTMDNEEQKDWLTTFVEGQLSTPERQIRLSNIDGILGSDVSVREITISDAEGVWLRVNNARLNWNQAALFTGRLEVRTLAADSIEYVRNAVPAEGAIDLPAPEASGIEIPEFPVAIILDELIVPSVTFGENVFGLGSEISLAGALSLADGNLDATLDIMRLDGPGGTLDLDIAYLQEGNTVDLGLSLVEPENGVIANLLNIEGRPAVTLNIAGAGPVSDLRTALSLVADGQTALSGAATLVQGADGLNIGADLRGPLSTLIAEPYRPFFGAETALSFSALVREGGGIEVPSFQLAGGQLMLSGSAATTADNFVSRLALEAVIADSTGAPVTLPVPGNATRVGNLGATVRFQDGQWLAELGIDDLSTAGLDAERVSLDLSGAASNLDDPATRMVTFNGDGAISGISGSAEVEAALGDSIGLGLAGLWNAGQPIQLAELRVVGEALTAALSGQIDGLDFIGDIALETASIAPFSGLAGQDLSGALDLRANGTVMPASGGFDLTLDGTGTNLEIGQELPDRLLAGSVQLDGRIARSEAGITAEGFSIANEQVQLTADGNFSSTLADFRFDLDLSDLALLSEEASGAVSVEGTANGTAEAGIDLVLLAQVPRGMLAGRTLVEGRFGFNGELLGADLNGQVDGEATIDGYLATLTAGLAVGSETQSLNGLEFRAAGTQLTGSVSRNVASGMLDGQLNLQSPDIAVAAALALLDARGQVALDIALAPVADGEQPVQGANVEGQVSNLSVNDIRVGRADLAATVTDLFGTVPAIDGTVTATDVAAAGVEIDTLSGRAAQSGSTTNFDMQAALTTGTDVDVAGNLTPVDDGYRLALDRASLTQGQLSARLAQPTVLEVAGSNVTLNAVRFDVGSGSITATGSAGDALDIALNINALPLSIANAVAPELGLSGTLNGDARITGSGSDPRVSFTARADGVSASAIAGFGITPLSASASGSFASNTVTLSQLSASGAGGLGITGSGTVPLSGGGLSVQLTGSAPLALGNRFVADRGGQLSGVATLNASITGSLANPQFGGSVSTSGAGYIDPELNLRLVGINGSASLNGTNLVIDRLSASLATGGTVSASGSVGLSANMPANVQVALSSARYADGNIFVATLSGDLALTGNLTGSPLLSGNVFVEEANITVPASFGGGAALIDVEHVRTPPAVEQTLQRARIDDATGAPIPQNRPGGLLLDINVNAPNQIFVRGRGLDAEVGGSVRITGPINDIQPVGGFSLNRGRLSILGQRVTFESGTVTLVGDLDPFLNLVARTEGDGITVFVNVSGRVSDIDVSFTSNPALPQDEVLARLIFNRSMGELSPLQLVRLAGAAAELAGGGGGGLADSFRDAAGLADLDVVTDDQGNLAVQAGTYIQDNVYLGVQAGANGDSRVTINLDVTDDLTVKGAAGQDGNSSLGVFFERDW